MSYDKLLSENLRNVDGLSRGYYGVNPYQSFQQVNKFQTPYQFPSAPNIQNLPNPFIMNDEVTAGSGFGLKYGSEPIYHSAVETPSHYGPPPDWQSHQMSKGGKLKGAALSALTLLAFLFFLNLLQSCLKDQMDAMNPTVMVMSAGQRNYLLNRQGGLNDEEYRKNDGNPDNVSEEDDKFRNDYDADEYTDGLPQAIENVEQTTSTRRRKKVNSKRVSKRRNYQTLMTQVATIEPKLRNKSKIRNSIA